MVIKGWTKDIVGLAGEMAIQEARYMPMSWQARQDAGLWQTTARDIAETGPGGGNNTVRRWRTLAAPWKTEQWRSEAEHWNSEHGQWKSDSAADNWWLDKNYFI